MHPLTIALSVVATTTLLAAQSTALTAHPQETLQNGNGNLVPFGVLNSGSFGEGRSMFLVPKDELPSQPALLVGMEIHCQGNVTLDYASLTINCGPTTATTLTSTFAANFPSTPTPVLQATSLQVTYASNAWTPIPFTTPYVHDGQSALVIEVQKLLQTAATYPFATMSTSSSPPRNDRPNMVYTFSTPGGGASQSPTGSYQANALSFRLQWQATPTLRNLSNVGTSGNQYNVGGQVTLTMQGSPSHLYVLAAATSFLPVALPLPGFGGALRLNNPLVFTGGLLDPNGVGTFVFPLPNDPSLAGYYLTYQGADIDGATGFITLTNGTDHFVNP